MRKKCIRSLAMLLTMILLLSAAYAEEMPEETLVSDATAAPAPATLPPKETSEATPQPSAQPLAESASRRIYIYSQHNGPEQDQEWAAKELDGNDMMHAGCHIYSYAHAIQWLTGDSATSETGGILLDELISLYDRPWDLTAMARYRNYLVSTYNAKKVQVPTYRKTLMEHFAAGGVILLNPGGHYILAVDAIEADLDQDGDVEPWLHIVDSACATTMFRLRPKNQFVYTFDTGEKIDNVTEEDTADTFHGGSWDRGGEYWMSFECYSSSAVRRDAAYLPGDCGRVEDGLGIYNVEYPSTYNFGSHGWNVRGGYIASNTKLQTVRSQLLDPDGNVISDSGDVSAKGYRYAVSSFEQLSAHNTGVAFSRISGTGTYQWIISASDSSGASVSVTLEINAVARGDTEVSTQE